MHGFHVVSGCSVPKPVGFGSPDLPDLTLLDCPCQDSLCYLHIPSHLYFLIPFNEQPANIDDDDDDTQHQESTSERMDYHVIPECPYPPMTEGTLNYFDSSPQGKHSHSEPKNLQ